ncbi:putative membrane protein [Acinetobacter sp. AR_0276]|nr:putative membrane protein [Acinetobacter sp. AR_0276]
MSHHLPALFKYLGLVLLSVGLIALFASLPKVVAAFCWFMLIIFAWSFLPFIALFKRKLVS